MGFRIKFVCRSIPSITYLPQKIHLFPFCKMKNHPFELYASIGTGIRNHKNPTNFYAYAKHSLGKRWYVSSQGCTKILLRRKALNVEEKFCNSQKGNFIYSPIDFALVLAPTLNTFYCFRVSFSTEVQKDMKTLITETWPLPFIAFRFWHWYHIYP